MNHLKQHELLRTPSGKPLPAMCYRDTHDLILDRLALAYLHKRHQNVFMYEGNRMFPQKSFNLFQHNMGLMDIALSMSQIKQLVENEEAHSPEQRAFVKTYLQGLPIHDHGEGVDEPMTFAMKCDYPQLVPYAKKLESFAAPILYQWALSSAVLGKSKKFLSETTAIQKQFRYDLDHLQADALKGSYDLAINQVMQHVGAGSRKMFKKLPHEQQQKILAMTEVYTLAYKAIEDDQSADHGAAQILIKITDKACPSYSHHAKQRYLDPNGTTPLHDQFTNQSILSDMIRKEKPIISYAKAIALDPVGQYFLPTALAIGYDAMIEYTQTMPPVISCDPDKPIYEVDRNASRGIWLNEAYLPNLRQVTENRDSGVHFLEDGLKTNLEMQAILETKKQRSEYLEKSVFDKSPNYSLSFAETAAHILDELKQAPAIKRHADYLYRM